MAPEKILGSLRIPKTGQTYELGHIYEANMPQYGDRPYYLNVQPAARPLKEVSAHGRHVLDLGRTDLQGRLPESRQMVADAGVSAGVVVAGLVILYTGWVWLDPLTSLVIVGVIVWGTWGLLRASLAMSVNAVPSTIDPEAVRRYLATCAGVSSVHDLHIWSMSTTESALTAHLVFPGGHPGDAFLLHAARELRHRFGIGHTTLQIEISEESACHLAPDDVV